MASSMDLYSLNTVLGRLAAAVGGDALGRALDDSVARHYEAQPVPVKTGRLRRALAQRPRATERRTVQAGSGALVVQILVPYARYQLRRIAPYRGDTLARDLGAYLLRSLTGGRP